jgi:hypothetical protein
VWCDERRENITATARAAAVALEDEEVKITFNIITSTSILRMFLFSTVVRHLCCVKQ